MHKVTLDDGRFIELPSALVREFPRVYELAVRYLQASDEEDAVRVVAEIAEAWASSLDPESLTLDDAWAILLAKAGPKAELLETLRSIMAEAMRDFTATDQGREIIRGMMEARTRDISGESA